MENVAFWKAAASNPPSIDVDEAEGGAGAWLPDMLERWLTKQLLSLDMTTSQPCLPPPPAWLEALRAERILRYDALAFPFTHLLEALFETTNLAGLHREDLRPDRPPLCPTLFRAYTNAGIKRPGAWRQSTKREAKYVKRFRESEPYQRFIAVYRSFVLEFVVPLLGQGELIYQCPPTMRCQMPSPVAACSPHRDSDYAAHHGAEINFWLPVTRAWGSNTLQVESEPGKADFHPLELGPGEVAIFNGSRCLHYTEANRTDSVRVSFDFRVIPRSLLGTGGCPRLTEKRHQTRGAATYQYDLFSTASPDAPFAMTT